MSDEDLFEAEQDSDVAYAPENLLIGFIRVGKKKDLERSILGVAERNFSNLRTAWYGYKKFQDGYLYEVHEGGEGKGVVSSLADQLLMNNQAIIGVSGRKVMVQKTRHGVESFRLNEDDDTPVSERIEFADQLHRIVTRGWGSFLIGSVIAGMGVMSLFLASLFKFVVFDRVEGVFFDESDKETPISQISKIKDIAFNKDVYISSVKYDKGHWLIKTDKVEKKAAEVPVEKMPDGGDAADLASSDGMLIPAAGEALSGEEMQLSGEAVLELEALLNEEMGNEIP